MKLKPIKLTTGGLLRNGQIHGGTDPMQQRPFNTSGPKSEGIARSGAPKVTPTPEINLGTLKHVTAPSHFFKHGAPPPMQDEKNIPLAREQPIPVHNGMTDRQRAKLDGSNDPGAILRDAANLGRKS